MPRKARPRNTTIYIPPPGPGPEVAGAAPSLEVLLMAQQIARQRGHAFDIESFLSPEQRAEYAALQGEDAPNDSEPASTGTSARSVSADGDGAADSRPGQGPEGDETTGTPPAKRIKLGPNTPLSQVYWKQRLERLARVRSRSATPLKEPEPPSPARSREASPSPWRGRELRDNAHHHHRKPQPPLTASDKADISSSASYWNHLLIQARAARGPQYDFNTRQLLFDRESEAHYTQGRPPREPTPPPPPPPPEAENEVEKQDKERGEKDKVKDKDKEKRTQPNGDAQGVPQPQPQQNGTPGKNRPPTPQQAQQAQQAQPPQSGPPLQSSPGQAQGTHARLAAAQAAQAQASVQAQALAMAGGPDGSFMNPGMMQIPQGVNPMALMGGGGAQQGPMLGGGQGPMLGGGWQDN